MLEKQKLGGLDRFRMIAAFLVIMIHTSPLATYSQVADFWLTRVLARIGVPFFLMVSGYFSLPGMLLGTRTDTRSARRLVVHTALLYAAAILLYLPVGVYAGHFQSLTLGKLLKMLLFDGTFYHLWYLPATIMGALVLYVLSRKMQLPGVMLATALLYIIGLFGDSYYGAIAGAPALSNAYAAGFDMFSYTRNGLFYTPIFLVMGAWIAQRKTLPAKSAAIGFAATLLVMSAEALTLRHFALQRHDSMYALLPLCMFFLFQLLLRWTCTPRPDLRRISMWLYLLHPLAILLVRAVARPTGLWDILVKNSVGHYLAVCAFSIFLSIGVEWLFSRNRRSLRQSRAWIELDRSALNHNVAALRALLPKHCELMPAIKANAYGHGMCLTAKALNQVGVKAFCVACADEGIALRKAGIRGEILVLGYTEPRQLDLIRRWRLTQTVIDLSYAKMLEDYGKPLRVHVAIDTGMHRLGERSDNLNAIFEIFAMKNLRIKGLFTHLSADDTTAPADKAFTQTQADAFNEVVAALVAHGYSRPKLHLQASYGVLNYPELAGDYARIGIALYGTLSTRRDAQACTIPLKPVLSLKARIAAVKCVHAGECVGYGLDFVAQKSMKIAILTIGYADGLPRELSNGVGHVLIEGHAAPIVGRICMDQTLVDVTDIPHVESSDIAIIIGKSDHMEITACDLAEQTNTISNEILSRLGARLNREMH